ncbi:MAG: AAA family ATPase [Eubacteriales bacterium]|nr:AAA family ATPase [Eubacteriales bacterium]
MGGVYEKKVAIGLQNFEELIQKDYYYIDKTDFINFEAVPE